ncbi:biopolymer transport protein ExbD/TolR [Thalassobium sp. R2A62]|nr:biopolymer transporter ExbD [Thalassobium sp. R2A62]EET47840.1 biopolymer transport protein ExbD/TolR [Thalassobium sp. R2A62]
MTSLIDVIFLLLLFFMLSSTFTRFSEIQLFGASAGTQSTAAQSENTPIFLQLAPEDVRLNGQGFDLSRVPDGVAALRGLDEQMVLISATSDDVTAQRLVDVLMILATVPNLNVVVLE